MHCIALNERQIQILFLSSLLLMHRVYIESYQNFLLLNLRKFGGEKNEVSVRSGHLWLGCKVGIFSKMIK